MNFNYYWQVFLADNYVENANLNVENMNLMFKLQP